MIVSDGRDGGCFCARHSPKACSTLCVEVRGSPVRLPRTALRRGPHDDPLFCEGHARAHIAEAHDDDEAALLPVVNSPRMGICAYAGPGTIGTRSDCVDLLNGLVP